MSGSLQREWLTDIFESTPSLVFIALWRSGVDLEIAGWIGAVLAASALIGFRIYHVRFNPILLGINVHLLTITPLIVTIYHLGLSSLGETLETYSHKGVLVSIFVVGCTLTLRSREGMLGLSGPSVAQVMTCSIILLVASLATIIWSFAYADSTVPAVVLPIIALFGLRRLLIARWLDHKKNANGSLVAGGTMFSHGSGSDSL